MLSSWTIPHIYSYVKRISEINFNKSKQRRFLFISFTAISFHLAAYYLQFLNEKQSENTSFVSYYQPKLFELSILQSYKQVTLKESFIMGLSMVGVLEENS